MDDLISRQEAIHKIADHHRMVSNIMGDCGFMSGLDKAIEIINDLPSAQKTGKWIDIQVSVSGDGRATCDQCGAVVHNSFSSSINFCPNCGCRMEEGGQDEVN